MGDNSLKTPLGSSLNDLAIQRVAEGIRSTGRAWPASVVSVAGAIVTVRFEFGQTVPANIPQVTIPLFGPEYIRYPIQPGDKGVTFPADAYLGGLSGLGGGAADLTQQANLSALVFLPFGNVGWSEVDKRALTMYGPNGVVMRDTGGGSTITLTPGSIKTTTPDFIVQGPNGKSSLELTDSAITLKSNGHQIVIDASGVTIDGKVFLLHEHVGVTTGLGTTGIVA